MDESPETVLDLRELAVAFDTPSGRRAAVDVLDGIDLSVARGELVGLMGGSGAGKTTIARAITRSLPAATRVSGSIIVGGRDVMSLDRAGLRDLRSRVVATVPQGSGRALNPTMAVGRQVAEVLTNRGLDRAAARAGALDLLTRVAISEPGDLARRFPHQLSGGEQQRVLIAMALAARPRLLVLDEPTTGLDAATASSILRLLEELRLKDQTAVLLVTHDVELVVRLCARVGVLHAGRLVETGHTDQVMSSPRDPATVSLLGGIIHRGATRASTATATPPAPFEPLARVRKLVKRFGDTLACDDVELTIGRGEVVGIVGQSGSGKTTLARCLTGLTTYEGSVELDGVALPAALRHRRPHTRSRIQMVFQDPGGSLNPRHSVGRVLRRALRRAEASMTATELAATVHLDPALLRSPTRVLSAGQQQRVAIARAVAGHPALLVCDEPTSALDPPTQRAILDLLAELRRVEGIALLLISHDLAAVGYLADRTLTMHRGRLVDIEVCEHRDVEPAGRR